MKVCTSLVREKSNFCTDFLLFYKIVKSSTKSYQVLNIRSLQSMATVKYLEHLNSILCNFFSFIPSFVFEIQS
jgi:hypothetical protein